jgi:hypothetical protein
MSKTLREIYDYLTFCDVDEKEKLLTLLDIIEFRFSKLESNNSNWAKKLDKYLDKVQKDREEN